MGEIVYPAGGYSITGGDGKKCVGWGIIVGCVENAPKQDQ